MKDTEQESTHDVELGFDLVPKYGWPFTPHHRGLSRLAKTIIWIELAVIFAAFSYDIYLLGKTLYHMF